MKLDSAGNSMVFHAQIPDSTQGKKLVIPLQSPPEPVFLVFFKTTTTTQILFLRRKICESQPPEIEANLSL